MWTTQIRFRPVSSSPLLSPLISARRTPADQAAKIGGLCLDVLTTYKSKPDSVRPLMIANNQPNQIQHQEEEGQGLGTSQLRGSDVLLALQQAATRRRKKNKNSSSSRGAGSKSKSKKGTTWFGGSDDDDDDDVEENDHVPSSLMIKSDWCKRIEDLERRLQELSEI